MRALIFIVAVVLLLALAGWITFSGGPDRSSINIETQQIQEDADRALESGAGLIQRASDSVEPTPQTVPVTPAPSPQPSTAPATQ